MANKPVYYYRDREGTHPQFIDAQHLDQVWHEVGDSGEPEFLNGWVNVGGDYATLAFRKDGFDQVFLRGRITGGAVGTAVFTLPTGYRPAGTILFAGLASESCHIEVTASGDVKVVSAS